MSNLSDNNDPVRCQSEGSTQPHLLSLPGRRSVLGAGLTISRLLPQTQLRMIGPWCFLDHIGPVTLGDDQMIDVAPHPHTALQTATWMIEGELLHKDSLGYEQVIRPGQLNLMTAGHGISHSEQSPKDRSTAVHGVQFWIALPAAHKDIAPAFQHIAELPQRHYGAARVTVFVGELDGMRSPATVHSPMVGAELFAETECSLTLTLQPEFEHALMVTAGAASLGTETLAMDALHALGGGRDTLTLSLAANSRLMLIGGTPFAHPVLMWWNFVGHSDAEIRQALHDWEHSERFGTVSAYEKNTRLQAPVLNDGTRLRQ